MKSLLGSRPFSILYWSGLLLFFCGVIFMLQQQIMTGAVHDGIIGAILLSAVLWILADFLGSYRTVPSSAHAKVTAWKVVRTLSFILCLVLTVLFAAVLIGTFWVKYPSWFEDAKVDVLLVLMALLVVGGHRSENTEI